MYSYFWLIGLVDIVLAIHAVRTGRTHPWLWIILFVPIAGSIVYVATQVLDRGTARARPPDDVSQEMSAMLERGEYSEAIALGELALDDEEGPVRPRIMYLLAHASFADGSPRRAKEWLDELDRSGSRYRSRERTKLRGEVYAELFAKTPSSAA